jgi:hypothetical protein
MVKLGVNDILGREVPLVVNERWDAGVHEVKFDATGLSSEAYSYRLQARQIDGGQAGDFLQAKKLVILNVSLQTCSVL